MGEGTYSARKRDESLAFFGAITAGQSHEVTNVLNIISELAGLQQDLIRAGELGRPVDTARLADIATRISQQVVRGENLIRSINRFAHTVDLPVSVFDLKETIDQVVILAQRSARLAQVHIDIDFPADTMTIESNPFCVQHAVFVCMDLAIRFAVKARRIGITYVLCDKGCTITVSFADNLPSDPAVEEKLGFLRLLLGELGGELLESSEPTEPGRFVLWIPRKTHLPKT